MPPLKHIKRRIVSVRSTQQITKAMNLVAASKLQKMRIRAITAREMYETAAHMIDSAAAAPGAESCEFFGNERAVKTSAFVVITSDRGLCGGYNSNVCKAAMSAMDGKNELVVSIGAKGAAYFRRCNKDIAKKYTGSLDAAPFEVAEVIGNGLISSYLSGEVDEVYVVYTYFESMLSHVPTVRRILPIESDNSTPDTDMKYEPTPAKFLEDAVPEYINMFIYGAMEESSACEQAARMTSMDAASKNAEDIIEGLTLIYNRRRQSVITQELNEIVSGANALQ